VAKRLQVIVQEPEYRDIQRCGTIAAHGHCRMGAAGAGSGAQERTQPEVASKLDVIRAAARMDFPTADIDRMLEEIERGTVRVGTVIFVDSSIPMYLVGAAHPHKSDARLAAWKFSAPHYEQAAVIWIAHIAFDRLLGFGLKYGQAFKPTHLQSAAVFRAS
jgi:hypothetical protein